MNIDINDVMNRTKGFARLSLLSVLVLLFLSSHGQNGHHWTQQFGASSMFLGGSVIGGVNDLGAVYYNPGRLSQIDEQIVVYTGNVYEINTFKVKDLVGKKGYSSSEFRGVPNLTAGTFRVPFLKKHTFAWAVLIKNNSDIKIGIKDNLYGEIFPLSPGNDYFNASLNVLTNLKNTWSCLSWSYPLSERLSVGVTSVYSHITSERGVILDMAALDETSNQAASYNYNNSYKFSYDGLLWKAGVSYRYTRGTIGLTVLTPILKIGGKGEYNYENYASGLNHFSDKPDIFGYSDQTDLKVRYSSPLAIGVGISHRIKKNTVHAGAEWYSQVAGYNIMDPADFVIQSTGEVMTSNLADEQRSIINFGIGVELYLSEKLRSFASFYTDYNSLRKEVDSSTALLTAIHSDYFHVGGGFLLSLKDFSLSLGLTHSGTNSKLSRPLNFPSVEPVESSENNTSVDWDRWRVMFSLSIPLLKDFQRKLGL